MPITRKIFTLHFLITEQCNLSCEYCYRDKGAEATLTSHALKSSYDSVIQKLPADTHINIVFMGGEPFKAFDVLRDGITYMRTHSYGRKVSFKIITNGTLVHEDIQHWILENNEDVGIGLSLDGPPDIQDRFRTQSSQQIDISFFKTLTNLEILSVVHPESLETFSDNMIYLSKFGFPVKATYADGVDWKPIRDLPILEKELSKLAHYYIENPNIYPINFLAIATSALDCPPEKCLPGETSMAVDAHGEWYACHRCSPYYNNGNWKIPSDLISLSGITLSTLASECTQCVGKNLCQICRATIATVQHNLEAKTFICQAMKQTLAIGTWLQCQLLSACVTENRDLNSVALFANRSGQQVKAMIDGAKKLLHSIQTEKAF